MLMYLRAVKQALCGCAKEETAATRIEEGLIQWSPVLAQSQSCFLLYFDLLVSSFIRHKSQKMCFICQSR